MSDSLDCLTAKITQELAVKPECCITHPAELAVFKPLNRDELVRFAADHGWRVVRRIGGRQIEFYKDVGARSRE
jgi:hypothetical protein